MTVRMIAVAALMTILSGGLGSRVDAGTPEGGLGINTKSSDLRELPEPASLLLFGSGLVLVARRMRRARA